MCLRFFGEVRVEKYLPVAMTLEHVGERIGFLLSRRPLPDGESPAIGGLDEVLLVIPDKFAAQQPCHHRPRATVGPWVVGRRRVRSSEPSQVLAKLCDKWVEGRILEERDGAGLDLRV